MRVFGDFQTLCSKLMIEDEEESFAFFIFLSASVQHSLAKKFWKEEENKACLALDGVEYVVFHTRVICRANFSASNMGDFCREHPLEDIMLPRKQKRHT